MSDTQYFANALSNVEFTIIAIAMTKTYQFHRKGDILTATPVEPAHADTCGYFAGLKNGEVAVMVWPCAAGGTIDTTHGVGLVGVLPRQQSQVPPHPT